MTKQVLVRVIDVVDAAQKGFDAAERCEYEPIANHLQELSETLLSAAVVVLRHRRAMIPVEVQDTMYRLNEAMNRADKLRKTKE